MELKNFFAQDTKGNVIPFATVTVYNQGTTVRPTLYGPDGAAITNPFIVGNTGLAQFRAANGEYDVKVITTDGEYTLTMQCNDVGDTVAAAAQEADRAESEADRAQSLVDDFEPVGSYINVNTATGEQTLVDALDQRGPVFDSVADMKAAANLTVGIKVRTLGYYTPGDGGGNDYEIVAASTGANDGGSFIDLAGSGLQAKGLFVDGAVHVEQFGAVGDGTTNDALAFTRIERLFPGHMVDLGGQVYSVPSVPNKCIYVNGSFRVDGFTKPAVEKFTPLGAAPRFHAFGGQLINLRESLSNPLEQLTSVVFIGDSITWGSGNVDEQAVTTPRNGTLNDPRDYFGTSSFVNIFKRYIGSNYFDDAAPIVSNWIDAVSGETTVEYSRDIVLWPRTDGFTIESTGVSTNIVEQFVQGSSSPTWRSLLLQWVSVSGANPHKLKFDFTGTEFTLYYALTNTSPDTRYELLVDGVSQGTFTNAVGVDGGTTGFGNERTHTFGYVRNKEIEIRVLNDEPSITATMRIVGIGVTKKCRIINNGINGASARRYPATCLTTNYASTEAVGAEDNYVFVQLGTNDRTNPTESSSHPGAQNYLRQTLGFLVDEVERLTNNADVIMMCANPAQSQIPELRFQSMQQVRGEIMLLSKSRQLDFIDNYSIFYGLELRQYASDLLHPNQIGHTLIAANIVGAMESA